MSKDFNFDDVFNEDNQITEKYQLWEDEIGQRCFGVLVQIRNNDNPDKYGKIKKEYILHQEDGTDLVVGGRNLPKDGKIGSDYNIIFGMENKPLGAMMGFELTEIKDVGKGNPLKIIVPRWTGQKDLDVLKEYQDKFDIKEETKDTEVEPEEEITIEKAFGKDKPKK